MLCLLFFNFGHKNIFKDMVKTTHLAPAISVGVHGWRHVLHQFPVRIKLGQSVDNMVSCGLVNQTRKEGNDN